MSGRPKALTLIPLCALLASGMSQAADREERWVEFARDQELGVVSYYDAGSVREVDGYRQVWARDIPVDQKQEVTQIRALYQVDCGAPAVNVIKSLTYLRNGRVQEMSGSGSWMNIIDWGRDNPAIALHRAVCRAPAR